MLGIEQRRERSVALAQVEQVDRAARAERMQRARGRALLLDRAVAPADAVELVRGAQPDQVRDWLPFENVRIEIDLVAGDIEGRLPAVGEDKARLEALRADRMDDDAPGRLFFNERPVALRTDRNDQRQAAGAKQQHADQRSCEKAQRSRAQQRDEAGRQRDQPHKAEHDASVQEQRKIEGRRHRFREDAGKFKGTLSVGSDTRSQRSPTGACAVREYRAGMANAWSPTSSAC